VAAAFPELGGGVKPASRAPGSGSEAGEHARFRLFDAVSRLVREVGRRHSVLLILDDLHWADEPSLRLLQHAAEETRESPVMILGTYRLLETAGVLSDVLASLSRLRRFSSVAVHGLSRDDSRELLEVGRLGAVPEDLTEAAYRLTRGNRCICARYPSPSPDPMLGPPGPYTRSSRGVCISFARSLGPWSLPRPCWAASSRWACSTR